MPRADPRARWGSKLLALATFAEWSPKTPTPARKTCRSTATTNALIRYP